MQVFDRVELHPLAQQSGGANSRAAEPKIAPKNIKDSVFKTWIEPWKARFWSPPTSVSSLVASVLV